MSEQPRVVVLTSELDVLHVHALERPSGELRRVSSIRLPEQVHYAVADAGSRVLYVSASNGSTKHWLYAFAIDPADGRLAQLGSPVVPPDGRVIHLSIDDAAGYLILAHNQTSRLSTLRLAADGRLGEFVSQPPASTGFFAHQALLDLEGAHVVACGLGASASAAAPERPGSLNVFAYRAGMLSPTQSIELGPGLGARHLDYAQRRALVVIERGNRLFVYDYDHGVLGAEPRFDVSTLRAPEHVRPGQHAGGIAVHPGGRYLYVSNRARDTVPTEVGGQPVDVFAGGENNLALFELDPGSGAPRLLEHYDTRGFEPRTVSLDPAGQFLFAGNQSTRSVLHPDGRLERVPRSVAVFRVCDQGRLSYLSKYDFSAGEVFWVGSLALPSRS